MSEVFLTGDSNHIQLVSGDTSLLGSYSYTTGYFNYMVCFMTDMGWASRFDYAICIDEEQGERYQKYLEWCLMKAGDFLSEKSSQKEFLKEMEKVVTTDRKGRTIEGHIIETNRNMITVDEWRVTKHNLLQRLWNWIMRGRRSR